MVVLVIQAKSCILCKVSYFELSSVVLLIQNICLYLHLPDAAY